jgi:hypothetical protein
MPKLKKKNILKERLTINRTKMKKKKDMGDEELSCCWASLGALFRSENLKEF